MITREKIERFTVRCVVYNGNELVEVIEQPMTGLELKVALRRKHFRWRFESAMLKGYRITFERKEKHDNQS